MKAFAFFLLALMAVAQRPASHNSDAQPKIISATRPVAVFTRMEQALLTAIQKQDIEMLKSQLSQDFETLQPDSAPMAHDPWLQKVSGSSSYSAFRLSNVFVHSVTSDVALVSFVQSLKLDEKGTKFEDTFIVDYWQVQDGVWKLKVRYASPVQNFPHDAQRPSGKQ
jgi:hypothetical protein